MAIGLALGIQAFLVKPYQIPSPSMEPTLVPGERVLVNRLSYTLGGDPSVGDVVVFHPPTGADGNGRECAVNRGVDQACPQGTEEQSDQNFIKRIVAGPGDTLAIEDGHPVVNGVKKTDEPYIRACGSGDDLQFGGSDRDPARQLLHDGRQPWLERRQPILGPRPQGLDHRQGLLHLLAPQGSRPPLTAESPRRRR